MANVEPTAIVGPGLSQGPNISLHEFGELLKRHRGDRSLTQDAAAQLVDVSRPTWAQWEAGRHLPAEQRVQDIDRLLGAAGALIAAAERARSGHRLRPIDSAELASPHSGPTLFQVLADARTALLDQLIYDGEGEALGWRHNLVPTKEPWSPLSTAYGLKALAMLGGPDARTPAVARRVMDNAHRDSDGRIRGWSARTHSEPTLDTTATAIEALLRAGFEISVNDVVRILEDLLDETARQRPFVLTCALEPLLRVAPESELTHTIVTALLETRIEFEGVQLWPQKLLSRDQPLLDVSVAHTARAVAVLRSAPEDLVGDAVTSASQWLTDTGNLDGITEIIRRNRDGEPDDFPVHHFTSAWVALALARAPSPDRRAITRALKHVWSRYKPALHLWAWGDGDVPVWMLGDAVNALQNSAFALYDSPFPVD